MTNRDELHRRRFALRNPYAFIEQLEGAQEPGQELADSALRVRRYLYQNPYAYLEELEAFGNDRRASPRANSFEEIEKLVIRLQQRLWNNRVRVSGGEIDPIEVLDVAAAASLIGFDFALTDDFGAYSDGFKYMVAGIIDRSKKLIRVSGEMSGEKRRFTAAHELGHAILHPHLEALHRDKPLDGSFFQRDRLELEADKFATYFLMPSKLVRRAFKTRFKAEHFSLNEATSFALDREPWIAVANRYDTLRKLSRRIASATHFNGEQRYSLAEYFGVSIGAMAIRIEELGLISR